MSFSKALFYLVLSASPLALAADEHAEVIARARAHVGPEDKLKSVESIRYVGTIDVFLATDKKDEKGEPVFEKRTAKLDARYKRPWLQRVDLDFGNTLEIRAINETGGWIRVDNKKGQATMDVMGMATWKESRANSIENLLFYSVEGAPGALSVYQGKADFEGKPCHRTLTTYDGYITYERYFSAETGRIVATVHDKTLVMKESGSIKTNNGLNFPATLETHRNGVLLNRFTFERVEVNAPMDAEVFERPMFKGASKTP